MAKPKRRTTAESKLTGKQINGVLSRGTTSQKPAVAPEGGMDWDEYYMSIAMAVRRRANCMGRKVGAIIVRENRIISTGYNGTPEGVRNCTEGGCVRCRDKESFERGADYDVCICVHAEQNALIAAARFGNAVEGSTIYTTLQPCFDCTKAALQAKIRAVYYLYDWPPRSDALKEQYEILQRKLRVHRITMQDDDAEWADPAFRRPVESTQR